MSTVIERILASLSDLLTIIASGIALYVAIAKRKELSLALRYIINYSKRLSLNDLILKLDRLNSLSADSAEQKQEVLNIFNEIEGQINGNKELSNEFSETLRKIKRCTNSKTIEEPSKRSLVSEIREKIRISELDILKKKMQKK